MSKVTNLVIRDVCAEINLGAIKSNLTKIRKHIQPQSKLCVVVTANAYGHSAVEVAKVANEIGADFLAVATVEEGLQLSYAGFREGFKQSILVLGLIPETAIDISVQMGLTLTVCDFDFAKKISDIAAKIDIVAKVHLKVETGMGRIGIFPDDAVEVAEKISKLPNVELEGIFSHFADADSIDKTFTMKQLEIFKNVCEKISSRGIEIKIRHIAESAAILEIPDAHLDMVRSGIITYGLYPSQDVKKNIQLQSAMTLKAKIAYIKKISVGTSIGYGRDFVAQKNSVIATLPLGYADGYIRAYKNFSVEVRGKLAPIVGRICMDQCMVDVTDIPDAKVGDEVILFGSDLISIDDAAKHLQTINYEVTCLVSGRVPRNYLR